MMETPETITNSQIKIETALKERKAFDEQSATKLEELEANFASVLDVMEKSGLIGKTPEGKIYMTLKGQEQKIKDFSVSNNLPPVRKFVRFSRNK
ncbi:MAG: hypothetical protein ACXV2C_05420 [Candidatus Bathyarchaeia archaeon]